MQNNLISLEHQISHLLQDCTFNQLKQIHAFIITKPINANIPIFAKLLRRSSEFGYMDYPELIFRQNSLPDIFLWNNMIRGYAHNGPVHKCISMYIQMQKHGTKPNSFTYPYVLKACSKLRNCEVGNTIHCRVIKEGSVGIEIISTSLFDFYIEIDNLRCAHHLFDEIPQRSFGKLRDAGRFFDQIVIKPVQVWNRMISENVKYGEIELARKVFDEMPERDVVSWNTMISGYAKFGDLESCRVLFERMPERNVVSWTSMIGAFAKAGDLKMARQLFDEMPERNVVSWNSMILYYTQNGKIGEALSLFMEMKKEVIPDGFTIVSALSCCARAGLLDLGKWIHFCFVSNGSELVVQVGTALIEMYARCGDIDGALRVFIKMINKDVFCWNVMIKSLAIHGKNKHAIKLFSMMQDRGFDPNDFTFTSLLFACNHGGLIEQGVQLFEYMTRGFGIDPKIEHYGCLIDLLARNGQLEEALVITKQMPFEPDIAVWGALLGGCRVKGDVKLAGEVMERITELKTDEPGVYVLASNIYASVDRWSDALRTRERMEERKIWKKAGSSMLGG